MMFFNKLCSLEKIQNYVVVVVVAKTQLLISQEGIYARLPSLSSGVLEIAVLGRRQHV
jgi:hypothetical protein